MKADAVTELAEWFKNNSRLLPWRGKVTPYQVWVSEVMLQQTQVAVVIPYYTRWMEQLPSVQMLADASEETVLKLWEGLGYYSRARRLHRGAQQVVEKYGGYLPSNESDLLSISGIGAYTAGAIRSFAFHQRAAAVDGNVLRVLARYYAVTEAIDLSSTAALLRQRADALLPDDEPWMVTEALIELGATVCKRSAECHRCPLQTSCSGYKQGLQNTLPCKRPPPATRELHRFVAVVTKEASILVRKVPAGQLMAGLWEFPYLEAESKNLCLNDFQNWLEHQFGIENNTTKPLDKISHSFTRYRAYLYPRIIDAVPTKIPEEYSWMTIAEMKKLSFPSGHREIAQRMTELA